MPTDTANTSATTPCTRCNGTGTYQGPSRYGRRCFTCGGNGRVTADAAQSFGWHQSTAINSRGDTVQVTVPVGHTSRQPRADRNWHEFASRYPAEAAWLQSPASGTFGQSLIKGCRRYGGLTPRQLAAVQRSVPAQPTVSDAPSEAISGPRVDHVRCHVTAMAREAELLRHAARAISAPTPVAPPSRSVENLRRATDPAESDRLRAMVAPTPAPITVDATNVRRAMDAAAASGLRKVKLVLGAVTFKLSGSRWSNGAGMILCYEGGSYAGWIDRSDVFHKAMHRTVTDAMLAAFRAAASDPQAAARTYGHDTGHCSCCRRLLTDPPSVMAGIGPICQRRFGWL